LLKKKKKYKKRDYLKSKTNRKAICELTYKRVTCHRSRRSEHLKLDKEFSPELLPILQSWYIKPNVALVVDPLSRMFGADASVAILSSFSKDNPDYQGFPRPLSLSFTRPLEIIPSAPTGMNVHWIAQTNPKSFGVTNLKELATARSDL